MKKKKLVSVITPVLNDHKHIKTCLESVSKQTYPNIEHIIVDGKSQDGTLEIIRSFKTRKTIKIISEEDKGDVDAANKGIDYAHGSIIGILGSDDIYNSNKVIEKVIQKLRKTGAGLCWGDLVYVKENNTNHIVRYWKSSSYKENLFASGWVPPHPTVFVKKKLYNKYGKYDIKLQAGDYEWLLRILKKYKVKSAYIPEVLVKMRLGGISNRSVKSIIKGNKSIYRAWKKNGFHFPLLYFPRKIILKRFPQFLTAKFKKL